MDHKFHLPKKMLLEGFFQIKNSRQNDFDVLLGTHQQLLLIFNY